jgi:acetyl esterase/lipase
VKVLHRRAFLSLGAVVVAEAAAQGAAPPARLKPPAPLTALPRAWLDAQALPVWPGDPPGVVSFTAQGAPTELAAVFIHDVSQPNMRVFRPAKPNGHALLVVPGGAYAFVSVVNEGVDVAARMTALGFTVFVLTYRLPGEGWKNRSDVPLQDAQRAMRVIRANAARFAVDATKISVLGFSAGGHLAATLATQHSEQVYSRVDAVDELSARPRGAGLVYPVISMDASITHERSRKLLLGESPHAAQIEHRSAERHVDADTPSAFLVHAFDDMAVPVENSLRFMNAMRAAKRPVEAHLLQEGGHAFGIGLPGTPSESWVTLFSVWLHRQG